MFCQRVLIVIYFVSEFVAISCCDINSITSAIYTTFFSSSFSGQEFSIRIKFMRSSKEDYETIFEFRRLSSYEGGANVVLSKLDSFASLVTTSALVCEFSIPLLLSTASSYEGGTISSQVDFDGVLTSK